MVRECLTSDRSQHWSAHAVAGVTRNTYLKVAQAGWESTANKKFCMLR